MTLGTVDLGWSVDGVPIVAGVTTQLVRHAITMLIGPNGSGKTTTMMMMAGALRPTQGRVLLDGEPLACYSRAERARRIALIEQSPHTNLNMRVKDVVELGRIPHQGRWPSAHRGHSSAVDKAMHTTGVAQLADRGWATLSGGERQRVHLARALAQEPTYLLLDEPANHLDLRHQLGLLETIKALGLTTLIVMHDLDLAAAYGDQIWVMNSGRLAAQGNPVEVLKPSAVEEIFGVRSRIETTDRLRFSWLGLAK